MYGRNIFPQPLWFGNGTSGIIPYLKLKTKKKTNLYCRHLHRYTWLLIINEPIAAGFQKQTQSPCLGSGLKVHAAELNQADLPSVG